MIIRRADIPADQIPEKADFPDAEYLEIGWGKVNYPAKALGLWLTLKAALWPTASVLHIAGIRGEPISAFAGWEIVRLDLDRRAWMQLIRYIHGSFARNRGQRVKPWREAFMETVGSTRHAVDFICSILNLIVGLPKGYGRLVCG